MRIQVEYDSPPVGTIARNVGLHFLLGAGSGMLVSAILGARNKELIPGFIFGGLGGALPDIDHPLTGTRSFGHGVPATIAGGTAIVGGAAISVKKKGLGRGISAFGAGVVSHQIADTYSWGI